MRLFHGYQPNSSDRFTINVETVIFNTVHENPLHLINYIILLVKQYIYVQKCLKKECNYNGLSNYVESARRCEYYNAKQSLKVRTFVKKWYNVRKSDFEKIGKGQHTHFNDTVEQYIYESMIE